MNWHCGWVVGCAAITCVGGSCALLWGGASGAVFTEWGGNSSLCENVCIFIEWTPNTKIFECLNFETCELLVLGSWATLALSSRSPPLFRPSGRWLSSRWRARVMSRAPPLAMAFPTRDPTYSSGHLALGEEQWQSPPQPLAWGYPSIGKSQVPTRIWI